MCALVLAIGERMLCLPSERCYYRYCYLQRSPLSDSLLSHSSGSSTTSYCYAVWWLCHDWWCYYLTSHLNGSYYLKTHYLRLWCCV